MWRFFFLAWGSLGFFVTLGCAGSPVTNMDGTTPVPDSGISGDQSPFQNGRDSGDQGMSEPKLRKCQRACTTVNECCQTPPCDVGPDRYACKDGYCRFEGCLDTTDCQNLSGAACVSVNGVRVCAETCKQNTDCLINNDVCVDQSYCMMSSTPADFPPCEADGKCPDVLGINHCYPWKNICGCLDDTGCANISQTLGGVYQCVEFNFSIDSD